MLTRVGWIFLALVVLGVAALASMTRFGGSGTGRPSVDGHVEEVVRSAVTRLRGDGYPLLIVPVQGVARSAITDTWGQARAEGREHHGTDIPAPQGTPVLAAANGTIEKMFASGLGGTTLYQRSTDGRWLFYYAHLSGYAPSLREGQAVRAGSAIAFVGDTGDAGAGNYHLHFGVERLSPGQHWWEGQAINPFPLLAPHQH